ncbi:hypothetical protein WA1_40985 [Scytonema hofmannii PCC 7110]|uniref:Uncharacterized protein n=1 Tax=Scytonema hofmannii PCC 7110 TaxID=128403 RepID=A0A139WUN3_9CYAN|nr:hypothetical protein WA1_40985 [Scytonema hofmannii PCC 7110]
MFPNMLLQKLQRSYLEETVGECWVRLPTHSLAPSWNSFLGGGASTNEEHQGNFEEHQRNFERHQIHVLLILGKVYLLAYRMKV